MSVMMLNEFQESCRVFRDFEKKGYFEPFFYKDIKIGYIGHNLPYKYYQAKTLHNPPTFSNPNSDETFLKNWLVKLYKQWQEDRKFEHDMFRGHLTRSVMDTGGLPPGKDPEMTKPIKIKIN